MADEGGEIEQKVETLDAETNDMVEVKIPEKAGKVSKSESDDVFDAALQRITYKMWDDRPRNKSKAKRKKVSKDDEKNLIDQLIQASNSSCPHATSPVEYLAQRFLHLLIENKSFESKIDDLTRHCSLLVKEKEDLTGQNKKSRLALSKLENLCRELQKHNRLMKAECDHRTRAEEAKREELSSKFQSSIGEITNQMKDNQSRNQQLKTDNAELASKLKGLVDQYEKREEYVDKVVKHKQIENQLLEAKLAQQSLELTEERERSLKEKQILLQESLKYQQKCELLVKEEVELKSQLSVYTEKFEEFQVTLTKSNEVFGTFKKEMDKMTKTIKKLEKETSVWKHKWERSNQSLVKIAEENKQKDAQMVKINQKNEKLEKLCRALQTERNELSQKMAAVDIKDDEETSNVTMNESNELEATDQQPEFTNGHTQNADNEEETASKPESEREPVELNSCQDTCDENQIENMLNVIPNIDLEPSQNGYETELGNNQCNQHEEVENEKPEDEHGVVDTSEELEDETQDENDEKQECEDSVNPDNSERSQQETLDDEQ